jgi:hypothetical protein
MRLGLYLPIRDVPLFAGAPVYVHVDGSGGFEKKLTLGGNSLTPLKANLSVASELRYVIGLGEHGAFSSHTIAHVCRTPPTNHPCVLMVGADDGIYDG